MAYSRSGKTRLVVDCRHINGCIHKFKFKFEDGSVAREIFEQGIFYLDLLSRAPIIIFLFWFNTGHTLVLVGSLKGKTGFFLFLMHYHLALQVQVIFLSFERSCKTLEKSWNLNYFVS